MCVTLRAGQRSDHGNLRLAGTAGRGRRCDISHQTAGSPLLLICSNLHLVLLLTSCCSSVSSAWAAASQCAAETGVVAAAIVAQSGYNISWSCTNSAATAPSRLSASATKFDFPATCCRSVVNSAMAARCRCCRGLCGSAIFLIAAVSGW